jgi:hypothetical protein
VYTHAKKGGGRKGEGITIKITRNRPSEKGQTKGVVSGTEKGSSQKNEWGERRYGRTLSVTVNDEWEEGRCMSLGEGGLRNALCGKGTCLMVVQHVQKTKHIERR